MAHLVKQLFAAFLVCVAVGHSPTLRAEALSLEDYAALADALAVPSAPAG